MATVTSLCIRVYVPFDNLSPRGVNRRQSQLEGILQKPGKINLGHFPKFVKINYSIIDLSKPKIMFPKLIVRTFFL